MNMKTINFAAMLESALLLWPKELDLSAISVHDNDRYSVTGLGILLEQIEQQYIGKLDEIIWRELHWSIYSIVHGLAKGLLRLKCSDIRAQAVLMVFKKRLTVAMADKEPIWSESDLIKIDQFLNSDFSSK